MEHTEETRAKKDRMLPMSILAAGILVSVSIIYATGKRSVSGEPLAADLSAVLKKSAPVSAADHVRGNPDAPVKVIEYSDLECPFCKSFHATMKNTLAAENGRVAWVYRHFPLDGLHSKARKEAEATECAAELGGNDAFWKYIDRVFEITPSNDGLDLALLPDIAGEIGLDKAQFTACLESGRHAAKVNADAKNAVESGGGGTPYSIVVGKNKKMFAVPYAAPYEGDPARPNTVPLKAYIEEAVK